MPAGGSAYKLVLLPGMQGTGDLFADFVEALPSAFPVQVVAYPNDVSLSYADLLTFLRSLLPSAEQYVIVAESFSTPLAIQFAATNPPNLKGLVLSAGFATSPIRGFLQFLTPILAPPLSRLPVNKFGSRIMLIGSTASPALQARIKDAIASVKPKVLMDRIRAVVACNALEDICKIKVPILYMQARHDRLVDPVCLKEIRRAKPDIEVVALDSSHMILQQLPLRAAEIVTDFAGRLS